MTSGLAARRIEALSDDEVYYCYIYLYYCCYIYLYYCLAARRIEALSDDEVIRTIERVLAAIFERIRRLPLILPLCLSLSAHIYICR